MISRLQEENDLYLLGGTWGMQQGKGGLKGEGFLDDQQLFALQEKTGLLDPALSPEQRRGIERSLATQLFHIFQRQLELTASVHQVFGHSCPDLAQYFGGHVYQLFSFDSSHKRPPIIAALVALLIDCAVKKPNFPLAAAAGTDTADIAELQCYEALTFDETRFPPLLETGARKTLEEPESDAPGNFALLGMVAQKNCLPPGAYWLSDGSCFIAGDLVKIDPDEGRKIEGQRTFFSPHKLQRPIAQVITGSRRETKVALEETAPVYRLHQPIDVISLYNAISSVYVLHAGLQNDIGLEARNVLDPFIRAIVVAGHGLGNVDHQIKALIAEAIRQGKQVVATSRCLIPNVTGRYEASLLAHQQILDGIIDGGKLNPAISKYLLARALLENRDAKSTRGLFHRYKKARKLVTTAATTIMTA